LAMAAEIGLMVISPTALLPNGAGPSAESRKIERNAGAGGPRR
jgi:hypothetical protein